MRKGRREEFNKEARKPGEEDMNEKRKKGKKRLPSVGEANGDKTVVS